jgi:hypothetical protein
MKIILLLLTISCCCLSQDLNFFSEDITFHLDSENFKVEGYYWFYNSSSEKIERMLFYPFPYSEAQSIDSVDILNIYSRKHESIINQTGRGFYFFLQLNPGDTGLYRIIYNQKVTSDSVVYILQSTRTWGKPLETAEYKLIVNNPLEAAAFSYQPDKNYKINNTIIYYWKRNNFLPDRNMVIHFTEVHY